MSKIIDDANLRQQILDHPLLRLNRQRLDRLTSRTIFMATDTLREKLAQLEREAHKRRVI